MIQDRGLCGCARVSAPISGAAPLPWSPKAQAVGLFSLRSCSVAPPTPASPSGIYPCAPTMASLPGRKSSSVYRTESSWPSTGSGVCGSCCLGCARPHPTVPCPPCLPAPHSPVFCRISFLASHVDTDSSLVFISLDHFHQNIAKEKVPVWNQSPILSQKLFSSNL